MDRDMIIFSGLHCKVNTKAAFVDMCLETPALATKMLDSPVLIAECEKKLCSMEAEERGKVFALKVELNEEKREQIYEEVFGEKLTEGNFGKLSDVYQRLLQPIRIMHKKEIMIDVIPFITYAVIRNSRCRSMLLESVAGCEKECLEAFQGSEYQSERFLRKFLLDERKAAKLAVGLLLLLREEASQKKYQMVMSIIYAGYKSLKNVVKKLEHLEGKQFEELMEKDIMVELILSQMVIEMVIAEDLGIPRLEDYQFCQVVCMLKVYEDRRLHPQEKDVDMTEGKRIYRRFLREHREPGAYYVSDFLDKKNQEMCERWEKLEDLLNIFGMETRALYGICLEKWEAEMLCSIFEERDWERYKYILLLATLCKYIQQIETMYENEIPEEIQYRKSCEDREVKSLEYARKRMEERICSLELKKKEKESELDETKRQIERMERESRKKEARHEEEKAELARLRELIFQRKGGTCGITEDFQRKGGAKGFQRKGEVCDITEDFQRRGEACDITEEFERKGKTCGIADEEKSGEGIGSFGKRFDAGRLEQSIVIGGHRNWQRKLRRRLPDSQFLASDYMNFDPAVLHNKKYIIVNTDILKHGLYYKIMNERKKGQKILYVHGNNIDRTLREIAEQLG